ncbi:MAG: PLP-dependent aminotransferase family protein [Burkholderiaceae bacterium]
MTASGTAGTLVERVVEQVAARIGGRGLPPGARLPSIRSAAREFGVSRFTVVEAYDRLVARGLIESRRGSGFYVRQVEVIAPTRRVHAWAEAQTAGVDHVWLLRNMFKRLPPEMMPGAGVLPPSWLDAELIEQSLRAVGRHAGPAMLDYGHPQGYPPLREQICQRLERLSIPATVDGLLCTTGVTQGLDLVAQRYLRAGDPVLVESPSWFVLFGQFAALGLRVLGVPRLADGPCLETLETLVKRYRPRLFFVSGALHNPTGSTISVNRAHRLLQLAETHDLTIVEDDVNADFLPDALLGQGPRLAAADGLRRVIYLGGFSKSLAANLRVGFVATTADRARELTDLKMLQGLTSPELGERVVYRALSEGHYRRHLHRLQNRLEQARGALVQALEALDMPVFVVPRGGMFVYARSALPARALAERMMDHGYLMAPGDLFMPDGEHSQWSRFNVATSLEPAMLNCLRSALAGPDAADRSDGSRHKLPS